MTDRFSEWEWLNLKLHTAGNSSSHEYTEEDWGLGKYEAVGPFRSLRKPGVELERGEMFCPALFMKWWWAHDISEPSHRFPLLSCRRCFWEYVTVDWGRLGCTGSRCWMPLDGHTYSDLSTDDIHTDCFLQCCVLCSGNKCGALNDLTMKFFCGNIKIPTA